MDYFKVGYEDGKNNTTTSFPNLSQEESKAYWKGLCTARREKTDPKTAEFCRKLAELCREYDISFVSGCGCCGGELSRKDCGDFVFDNVNNGPGEEW